MLNLAPVRPSTAAARRIDTLTVIVHLGHSTHAADGLAALTGAASIDQTGIEHSDSVTITRDDAIIERALVQLGEQIADHLGLSADEINVETSVDYNETHGVALEVRADGYVVDLNEPGQFVFEQFQLFEPVE